MERQRRYALRCLMYLERRHLVGHMGGAPQICAGLTNVLVMRLSNVQVILH